MIRHLQILLLVFVVIGCADQGATPVTPPESHIDSHVSLMPGIVVVIFSEGTTVEAAEQFVKDLNLTFEFPPSGSPLEAVVTVPIGSEDQWVAKLKTYPIVKSAGRMGVATQP